MTTDTSTGSSPATDGPGRLPDWLIIGAMKAATSSLHRYLAEHPQIATSTPKELDFFCEPKYSSSGIDWYRRQFDRPPGALVAGESSVNYTKCHEFPGVAERIHRHMPDVKLIYVLRDPIKRIESHWIHSVGSGKWRGDFSSAVRSPETSPMVLASAYWMQLSEYLTHFDPAQIRIVPYDRVSKEPGKVVSEILEFVGLDPEFEHPLIGKTIHPSNRKMRPNRIGLLFWEDQVRRRRLRKYVPWLVARPIEQPQWQPDDLERVREFLRPEAERIREFSGLDFADWSV